MLVCIRRGSKINNIKFLYQDIQLSRKCTKHFDILKFVSLLPFLKRILNEKDYDGSLYFYRKFLLTVLINLILCGSTSYIYITMQENQYNDFKKWEIFYIYFKIKTSTLITFSTFFPVFSQSLLGLFLYALNNRFTCRINTFSMVWTFGGSCSTNSHNLYLGNL